MSDPSVSSARGDLGALASLTAVVVAHNSGEALVACVRSLDDCGIGRIILVDNASSDDSVAEASIAVPRAEVVATGANLGYGGGVNAGMERVATDLALVCNSDLLVTRDAVSLLAARLMDDDRAALAAPRLVGPDGRSRPSARAFPSIRRSSVHALASVVRPSSRQASDYRLDNEALTAGGGDVDWVTGACLLVRTRAFRAVGGFDPGYFMYVEEVDLCWRLHRGGWHVLLAPEASVSHVGGASAGRRPYAMIVAHHRSLWRFSRRTAAGTDRYLLPIVAAGIALRATIVLARELVSNLRTRRSRPGAGS